MTTLVDPGHTPPARRDRRALFWAMVPVGLLGLMLVGWAVMITIAVNDPGFALEPDYYKKAVGWDRQQAQLAQDSRLGWHVELEQVAAANAGPTVSLATAALRADRPTAFDVLVHDAQGRAIVGAHVSAEAFFNARAARRIQATFSEIGDGRYRAALPIRHAGLWEFRVTVQSVAATFTATLRRDVTPASVPR